MLLCRDIGLISAVSEVFNGQTQVTAHPNESPFHCPNFSVPNILFCRICGPMHVLNHCLVATVKSFYETIQSQ